MKSPLDPGDIFPPRHIGPAPEDTEKMDMSKDTRSIV